MACFGYARVSTTDQDLDGQVAQLKSHGCEIVRSEKVSGGSREGRAELAKVIEFLRPGDELVVTRLDRLGRDTRDVLNLIHECEQKSATVTVLDPFVSTKGEMGHLVLTCLAWWRRWSVGSPRNDSARGSSAPRPKASIRAESAASITRRSRLCTEKEAGPQQLPGR